MDKSEPELKPCPFCGSESVAEEYSNTISTYEGSREKPTAWHEHQSGHVECKNCGAIGPDFFATDNEIDNLSKTVKEKWNKRNG